VTGKHRFRPFFLHTRPSQEALYELNAVAALHHGYQDSGLQIEEFAPEFYKAVGDVLAGARLKDLELDHLEIEGDVEW
jgi:hypothetical protein